jgi:hypothetical protein
MIRIHVRVYGEVEILCRQLGRRRPFIASMCNAGSDTEAIDDLRKQLKDARERYMVGHRLRCSDITAR